ncbi:MAG: hypothetical protein GX676_03380 [Bacilli bacterium]|nr:hypothetical protein [Bacilli bacterium]
MSNYLEEYKAQHNIKGEVALFFMRKDTTIFNNVKQWEKCFAIFNGNSLTLTRDDTSIDITLDEVNEVSFQQYDGNLWLVMNTNKGLFYGCMRYESYKHEESQKVINYLLPKCQDPTLYNTLINSSNRFAYYFNLKCHNLQLKDKFSKVKTRLVKIFKR